MTTKNNYFLLTVAKEAVNAYLTNPQAEFCLASEIPKKYRNIKKAVFVSIYDATNNLRGRMGTYQPTQDNIILEIIANAIAAATKDTRFSPISLSEIDQCHFIIDILSDLVEVESLSDINPEYEGLFLIKGQQKAIVLPKTVGTVTEQIRYLLEQAGLKDYYGAQISKFTVEHIS